MNEDAFARRFYADRAELESLGIALKVDKPSEGFLESELYALPPENYYLPAIEFTDARARGAAHGARAARRPVRLRRAAAAGAPAGLMGSQEPAEQRRAGADRDGDDRLGRGPGALPAARQDRDRDLPAQDDPVQLLHDGAGRDDGPKGRSLSPRLPLRPVLLDRLRARTRRGPGLPPLADPGKVSYASKAEHDFNPPGSFDRRDYASRADWQMGSTGRDRADLPPRPDRLAGRARLRRIRGDQPATNGDTKLGKGSVFATDFSSSRQLVAWLLGWRAERQRDRAGRAGERGGRAPRHAPQPTLEQLQDCQGRRVTCGRRRRAPGPLERQDRNRDPARALRPPRHPRRDADRLRPQRPPAADGRGLRASSGSPSRS